MAIERNSAGRIIAATHLDLEAMIRDGQFREDFFHRLNVVGIQLPPLRERREDVPARVQHFLRKYATDFGIVPPAITPDALAALQAEPWPGNIRELENVTHRLLLEARGRSITVEAVRDILAARASVGGQAPNSLPALAAKLLARAQPGEITDTHAQNVAEAERGLLTQPLRSPKATRPKPPAGWKFRG